MSFSEIIPYIQDSIRVIDPEMGEWEDGFNFENIPQTALDCVYFIDLGSPFVGAGQNMQCLNYSVPVIVRIWFKGFRDPYSARNTAMIKGEAIIKEFLRHENRLTKPGIKNVLSNSLTLNPIDVSNDNVVRLDLEFSFNLILEIT